MQASKETLNLKTYWRGRFIAGALAAILSGLAAAIAGGWFG